MEEFLMHDLKIRDLPILPRIVNRERKVGRLGHHRSIRGDGHVLREGPVPGTEHLVARSNVRDVLAHRFHLPREVGSQPVGLRLEEPDLGPGDVRRARQVVPVRWVHRSGANAYQHFVIPGDRPVELSKLDQIG